MNVEQVVLAIVVTTGIASIILDKGFYTGLQQRSGSCGILCHDFLSGYRGEDIFTVRWLALGCLLALTGGSAV